MMIETDREHSPHPAAPSAPSRTLRPALVSFKVSDTRMFAIRLSGKSLHRTNIPDVFILYIMYLFFTNDEFKMNDGVRRGAHLQRTGCGLLLSSISSL